MKLGLPMVVRHHLDPGCWKLNSGPLQEQPVSSTSEPSLQSQKKVVLLSIREFFSQSQIKVALNLDTNKNLKLSSNKGGLADAVVVRLYTFNTSVIPRVSRLVSSPPALIVTPVLSVCSQLCGISAGQQDPRTRQKPYKVSWVLF